MKRALLVFALCLLAAPARAQFTTTPAGGVVITPMLYVINVSSIGVTSTDGLTLQNTAAATVGTPVQISPRLRLRANVWNTTATAATNTSDAWWENVPVSGTAPVGGMRLGASDNGGANYYPMTVGGWPNANTLAALWLGAASPNTANYTLFSPATLTQTVVNTNAGQVELRIANVTHFSVGPLGVNINGPSNSPPANPLTITNAANTQNLLILGDTGLFTNVGSKTTAGLGIPAIVASANIAAQSSNATITAFTNGAADADFNVSAQMSVTASTTLATTITCTYTDVANVARTMIMPIQPLSGTFTAAGAITGAGASIWETPVMHVRAKASTTITILTSAGTFTGVTYSASGIIVELN